MKRIYLIDCPGVVPPNGNDSEEDILLRGVVRVENVENPHVYIPAVLKKVKPQHIERTYDVRGFSNATEFLELMARRSGRLLKGGEADVDGAAKMVLNDFLRGKLPWFTAPPPLEGEEEKEKGIKGRKGALGEMGKFKKPVEVNEEVAADPESGTTISEHTEDFPNVHVDKDTMARAEAAPLPEDDDDFAGFEDEDAKFEVGSEVSGSRPDDDDDDDDGGAELADEDDKDDPLCGEFEDGSNDEIGPKDVEKTKEAEEPPSRQLKRKRKG